MNSKSRPALVTAVVEDVNTEKLRLNLELGLSGVPSQDIDLLLLSPVTLSSGQSAQLQIGWLEKIFDTAGDKNDHSLTVLCDEILVLCH